MELSRIATGWSRRGPACGNEVLRYRRADGVRQAIRVASRRDVEERARTALLVEAAAILTPARSVFEGRPRRDRSVRLRPVLAFCLLA